MEKNRELNKTDANGESDKVAELTRLKPSALRSAEEKAWVGLDLLVNPEKYGHVTEMQAEEMKYDEQYQIRPGVGKEDIERILKLPRQLSLALPFLFTPDEIEIHRLTLK